MYLNRYIMFHLIHISGSCVSPRSNWLPVEGPKLPVGRNLQSWSWLSIKLNLKIKMVDNYHRVISFSFSFCPQKIVTCEKIVYLSDVTVTQIQTLIGVLSLTSNDSAENSRSGQNEIYYCWQLYYYTILLLLAQFSSE